MGKGDVIGKIKEKAKSISRSGIDPFTGKVEQEIEEERTQN